MWEIIEKNKKKSVIAFSVMTIWYTLIYGLIFGVIIMSFAAKLFCSRHNSCFVFNQDAVAVFYILGGIIALLVFIFRFSSIKDKPYKMDLCGIYPIDKQKNQQLYNIVEEVAIASGIEAVPKVYILDSDILNAYACGLNPKNSSIVVSKKLIEVLSRYELQGVIAHEMSHIINRDTMYLLCSGALYTIAVVLTLFFKEGMRSRGKGAAFFLLLFIISLIGQGICFLLFMFISRKREYLADACASIYTRYPKGLADALMKIENGSSQNIHSESPDNLVKASFIVPLEKRDSLFSTHPATQNRIQILMNMTSADYKEYEKEFQRINKKKLIPETALLNSKSVGIKDVNVVQLQPAVAAACALNSAVKDNNQVETIKRNKEVLKQNIKKHRDVEDMVRDLAGYNFINCDCGTKLKIPPVYKNQMIICPHCGKKHVNAV